MLFSSNVTPQHMHLANTRALVLRRAISVAVAASLVAIVALTVPRPLAADDARGRTCSNRTLRGDYGILITGVAPGGPTGQTEAVVATALRTYDGHGNFTQVDNVHGQSSGTVVDRSGFGTYEVRADCSGTAMLFFTGGPPFPVVSSFVIVDGGDEVKEAVMSPPPALVTAVQRRVER